MERVKHTFANLYQVFCLVLIILGLISCIALIAGLRPFVMISGSMDPEIPQNSLVILDTRVPFDEIQEGQNIAYLLGPMKALHKAARVTKDEITVRSLSDSGRTAVSRETFLGREWTSIPLVGGWLWGILRYRWIIIVTAIALIIAGCIPRKSFPQANPILRYPLFTSRKKEKKEEPKP